MVGVIMSTIVSLGVVYVAAVGLPFLFHDGGRQVATLYASAMLLSRAMVSLLMSATNWTGIGNLPGWLTLAGRDVRLRLRAGRMAVRPASRPCPVMESPGQPNAPGSGAYVLTVSRATGVKNHRGCVATRRQRCPPHPRPAAQGFVAPPPRPVR